MSDPELAKKLNKLGISPPEGLSGMTDVEAIISDEDVEYTEEPETPLDALKVIQEIFATPGTMKEVKNNRLAGWRRVALIKDLANGKLGIKVLAQKYEVNPPAIEAFRNRYADDIEALKAEAATLYDLLWSTEKANRIAEYQQDVDDINYLLERLPDKFKGGLTPSLMAKKHVALKSVSEELGELPPRISAAITPITVSYQIEGITVDDLT